MGEMWFESRYVRYIVDVLIMIAFVLKNNLFPYTSHILSLKKHSLKRIHDETIPHKITLNNVLSTGRFFLALYIFPRPQNRDILFQSNFCHWNG